MDLHQELKLSPLSRGDMRTTLRLLGFEILWLFVLLGLLAMMQGNRKNRAPNRIEKYHMCVYFDVVTLWLQSLEV